MLDEYSIADMALLPYAVSSIALSKAPRPNLKAWTKRLMERPAVQKGMALMQDEVRAETIAGDMEGFGEQHRDVLFGRSQFQER